MSAQGVYFERWLNENSLAAALTPEQKSSALAYFEKYQGPISEWCRQRNLICHAVDNVMGPNMMPYSSFLWQWSVHSGNEMLAKKLKLPTTRRVQNEIAECWQAVLGSSYQQFPFE